MSIESYMNGLGIDPGYLVIGAVAAFFLYQKFKKPKRIEKKDAYEAADEIDEKVVEKKPYIDITSIPQSYRFWGGIISAAFVWFGFSKEWAIQKIGVYLIIGWVLLYIMSVGTADTRIRKVLTWQECKIKLWDALRQSQLQPFGSEYSISPDAVIVIGDRNNLQERDGKPYARFMNYYIKHGRSVQEYIARIEPFTGHVMQTSKVLAGWRGDEPTAEVWLPSRELREELRRQKYEKR
ncbi:hypothetical protein KY343_06895 [Candidatus Woesearchaeota archaeon]|nr:hypothetical protein [Candidatus Woesearchaeota archaeon]